MKKGKSSKVKVQSLRGGVTFIEMLVSLSILMLVGSIILIVFFTSLRGTEKAQQLNSLRQNGNFALTQMVKSVKFAKGFPPGVICDSTTELSSVSVISAADSQETTYACTTSPDGVGNGIASQSANGTETQLIDNTVAQTETCAFICGYQPPLQQPFLKIHFSLIPTGADIQNADTPALDFSSTVFMLNAED